MITQSEIARKDFNRVCELNGYETFTKEQVEGYAGHIKSLIHKSETSNLSGGEIEAINTFNEDLPELHKAIVLNDDLTRELVYYRERKVIFDDVIEKSEGNDIEKARTGIYANTSQNRKLGRVGRKYDPRGKKAEEDKGKPEGKKEDLKEGDKVINTKTGETVSLKNKRESTGSVFPKGEVLFDYHNEKGEYKGTAPQSRFKKEGGEKKEEGNITDPKKVLELSKELNNIKAKRSQSQKDSPSYKEMSDKIDKMEARRITDKDGNTTGWKN